MNGFQPGETFLAEARDLLRRLESGLLELERRPSDQALVDDVFRALHTLKGSGAMFGPPALAAFAHEVETRFEVVRRGGEPATPALVGLLLEARDHLERLLEAPDEADPAATQRLVAGLHGTAAPATPATPATAQGPAKEVAAVMRTWRITIRLPATALEFGANPLGLLEELRGLGSCTVAARTDAVPALEALEPTKLYLSWEAILVTDKARAAIEDVFIFVADDGAVRIEELAEAAPAAAVPVALPAAAPAPRGEPSPAEDTRHTERPEASIRVAAGRLDALLDQVGELVIAQARLSALAHARKDPFLTSAVEEIERLSAELRESTMGMRMLPIGTLFGRYRRVVRDLSQELGKEVELHTAGEATELDKTMIERLGDPLVHLIRNSMDHGIEDAAARAARGKPRVGSILLEARQAGAEVLISIKDDGAGLDPGPTHEISAINAQGVVSQGRVRRQAKHMHSRLAN